MGNALIANSFRADPTKVGDNMPHSRKMFGPWPIRRSDSHAVAA